jgi:hypothetical protein
MPSGSADMMLNVAVFKYAYSRLNVGTSKICSCVAEVEPNTRISDGFNEDIEEGRDEYACQTMASALAWSHYLQPILLW